MELDRTRAYSYAKGCAVIAAFLAVNFFVRLPLRQFLNSAVGGIPYWLEHMTVMILADLLLAVGLGFWLLGWRDMYLGRPTSSRAWYLGLVGAAAAVVLIGGYLAATGQLHFFGKVDPLVALGNLFSNFYEEFIFRVVLVNLLRKYLASKWLAILVSATIFSLGHLSYPIPLVFIVFAIGVFLAWLVTKYQSIYPAWISHMAADLVADALFQM